MFIAEREGFEPPVPLGTTVFKTVVIDHSTISPWGVSASFLNAVAKLLLFEQIEEEKAKRFLYFTFFNLMTPIFLLSSPLPPVADW